MHDAPQPRTRPRDRLVDVLASDHLLIGLVAAFTALLALFVRDLMVADSWMTLMAGREIVQHGLPGAEALTSIPRGRDWVDQQWLAQLVFYGAERVGGLRATLALDVVLQVLAVAGALLVSRLRGASARSTLLVALPCIVAAPWAWQVRAQTLALPLFVAVLGLVSLDQGLRRRRTLLVAPLLVVWANVHGSVVIGAAIVSIAGFVALGRHLLGRDAPPPIRSLACAFLPWAAVLVSPYATALPGYYRTVLVDSPIADVVTEWQAPSPSGWELVFFAVAAATIVIALWQRRRLSAFDLAVLAFTLAGALRSSRGIVFFAFAAMALLPLAVDGLSGGDRGPSRRVAGTIVAAASVSLALIALAAGLVAADRPREGNWPSGAIRTLERSKPSRVLATERFADWLLWEIPSLRGRIAYDVRFELLTRDELDAIVRYKRRGEGWDDFARPYDVVVVDRRSTPALLPALRARGATTLFESDALAVVRIVRR